MRNIVFQPSIGINFDILRVLNANVKHETYDKIHVTPYNTVELLRGNVVIDSFELDTSGLDIHSISKSIKDLGYLKTISNAGSGYHVTVFQKRNGRKVKIWAYPDRFEVLFE